MWIDGCKINFIISYNSMSCVVFYSSFTILVNNYNVYLLTDYNFPCYRETRNYKLPDPEDFPMVKHLQNTKLN